jgi:hypothetical protein
MPNRIVFAVALALMALGASQDARAQTAQQQAACQYDAQTYCSAYIPDHDLIRRCLVSNMSRISAACRAQFKGGKKHPARRR